ncbi:hypothetical protein SDC9_188779 [bioreactor metagenome]|uniref:Uncharacterized protein n=1 Tax=bioreactor metagenome TaxID=1076179 RepID=A0A645HQI5_9ZZZZ
MSAGYTSVLGARFSLWQPAMQSLQPTQSSGSISMPPSADGLMAPKGHLAAQLSCSSGPQRHSPVRITRGCLSGCSRQSRWPGSYPSPAATLSKSSFSACLMAKSYSSQKVFIRISPATLHTVRFSIAQRGLLRDG